MNKIDKLQTMDIEISNIQIQRYIETKKAIELHESILNQLKPVITDILLDMPENNMAYNHLGTDYKLSLCERATWEYSEEVKALEKQLKNLKKIEELNGVAKKTGTTCFPSLKTA